MHGGKWVVTLLAVCGAALLLAGCPKPTPKFYSLAVQVEGQGTIALDPPGESHAAGTVVSITATAATGAHFDHWVGALSGNANPATITVNADASITAVFALDSHTLAYAAGNGGAVTGVTPQTVLYGGSGTAVFADAGTGHHFVRWSDESTVNPRTDTNVTADISVSAEFAPDPRTLAYTAGDHGTITGLTPQTVDYGTDGTEVGAVPDTGYHFTQWSDGVTTPARTDRNVTADLSVSASFAINVYTLDYSAGENGTLSGEAAQTVSHGGDGTAVTAVPNEGCHFVQWSDGLTTATRTDTNVTGDIAVSAEFGAGIILHVDADSTAAEPDGSTWATAYPNLQSAVDAAPDNAHIWVAEGTYISAADAVLSMRATVALYGGFSGTEIYRDQRDWNAHKSVIDGQETRCCVVGADNATLDGFTVTRGSSDVGGGMRNFSVSPVVAHCAFVENSASGYGGAMYNGVGSPTITDCVFSMNIANGGGGAMYNQNQNAPKISNCLFVKNETRPGLLPADGGAMHNNGASPVLTDCVFQENTAANDGGGIINSYGSPTLTGCIFIANSAKGSGGGMLNYSGLPVLIACRFTGNSASSGGAFATGDGAPSVINCVFTVNNATNGGAVHAESNNFRIINCTFTGNSAGTGGAITSSWRPLAITNCILWGDTARTGGAEIYLDNPAEESPTVSYSCVQGGYTGEGNIDSDPLFVDGDGGSLHLRSGSPCLDAGTATDAPATDLQGNPRPAGDGVDMGACEGAAAEGDLVALTLGGTPSQGGSLLPAAGVHHYVRDESVFLAVFLSGMRFTGWTGDVAGSAPTGFLVMDADKTVTANFALNVVYVTPAGKGTADGTSWATAYHDLQSAADAAPKDHSGEVWAAEGTYISTADQVLAMRRGVLLYGGFAGTETARDQRDWKAHRTVIDGEGTRRGVTGALHAVLDGFTVAHCYAGEGGGMLNDEVGPAVRNCRFVGNTAGDAGGAMLNTGNMPAPKISDCEFVDNTAYGNGGAINGFGDNAEIRRCSFVHNRAVGDYGFGGAISGSGGEALISDCSFVENTAGADGGAVLVQLNQLSMSRCVFVQNSTTGGSGGGLYVYAIFGRLENCVFVGNSATAGYGGGMSSPSQPKLVNCTFTRNAALSGGAMGVDTQGGAYPFTPDLTNCILWGDRAISESPEMYGARSDSLYVNHSCIQGGFPGAGNIDADPFFADDSDGSVQLGAGSPCLDTGTEADAPATDLLGRARPAGGGVDMGAYEGAAAAADLVTLTIQVSPPEGGHTQPEAGTHVFVRGDTAWVKALPLGMRFTGWTGDATESRQVLGLLMDADKTVTAEFVPNVLYVNAAHSGPSDGRSWATAYTIIEESQRIAAEDLGGEVWVAEGSYNGMSETGLILRPGVSLYGGFAGDETARSQRDANAHPTLIRGGGPYSFASAVIGADDAVLDGFTITKGQSGMFIRNCSPQVANCLFLDNAGMEGGGISNEGGSPMVVNCTFKQNKQGMYAAGMSSMGGSPTVKDCLFLENAGCGLYNGSASATVTGCRFENNNYGGMKNEFLSNDERNVTVTGCIFIGNTVEGGMCNMAWPPFNSHLAVTNSVFIRNASIRGGGVYSNAVSATFTNCTFTDNTATGDTTWAAQGGGYCQENGTAKMSNCIVWGNTATEGPEVLVAAGALTAEFSCVPPGYGEDGTFYLDPLFVDAVHGNLRLQTGSPCIDTGTVDGAPTADIDGTPRPRGAGFDIGAYER